ncbi:MAG: exodeoxyribonuclease III [Candidatus Eremiobacteraeota bacterium]|nr:exodeoxyribonuclease III [Candidatus Eremiobacteraeota bacterium]
MKIASWNVNGVRAAFRNGLPEWLAEEAPDILCLQETKAAPAELPDEIRAPLDYQGLWHSGERAGYSGVAILWKKPPLWTLEGMGLPEIDREGRVLTIELESFFLVNAYFPNSGEGGIRLPFKLEFCEWMMKFLKNLERRGKPVIVCGDFNIAHRPIDIHDFEKNANHSGCLPPERAWMDSLLEAGFIDVFRHHCQEGGHYTWWSYFAGERENNMGWRIDYFVCSGQLADRVRCSHRSQVMGSDHCPIVLEVC